MKIYNSLKWKISSHRQLTTIFYSIYEMTQTFLSLLVILLWDSRKYRYSDLGNQTAKILTNIYNSYISDLFQ